MVQTIKKAILELLVRKVIYLQYGILIVISMAVFGMFVDHMQFNRWFDKRVEKVATPPREAKIVYSPHSEGGRSAKRSFYWFDKGAIANKDYIVETCTDIKAGFVDYSFDYRPTCKKLGITID